MFHMWVSGPRLGLQARCRSWPAGTTWTPANRSCLLGDSRTGKSHLLIGLGLAACEHGRRVRYVTTAQLVNVLVEAADERVLSR